jgi:putative flippase GtrA
MIAVTGSYIMNSKITFTHETGGALNLTRYLRFVISGTLGITVATTFLVVLTHYTNVPIAKFVSLNFCMSHFVVFRSATVAR